MVKTVLSLTLYTQKEYDGVEFYESFFEELKTLHDGLFFPEKFGFGEPARYKFSENGISGAVDKWLMGECGLYMETLGKNKITFDISPERKSHYPRKFPDRVRILLSEHYVEQSIEKTVGLIKLLYRLFEPYYISASHCDDMRDKNYFKIKIKRGTASGYEGRNPEEKIPGVYWTNVFGPEFVNKIGKEKFETIPNEYKEGLHDGGFLLVLYNSPLDFNKTESKEVEEKIKDCLGRENIFDRESVDLQELKEKYEKF